MRNTCSKTPTAPLELNHDQQSEADRAIGRAERPSPPLSSERRKFPSQSPSPLPLGRTRRVPSPPPRPAQDWDPRQSVQSLPGGPVRRELLSRATAEDPNPAQGSTHPIPGRDSQETGEESSALTWEGGGGGAGRTRPSRCVCLRGACCAAGLGCGYGGKEERKKARRWAVFSVGTKSSVDYISHV
jgi:hypothetical protein